jgi:hypothetical protein
MNADNAAYMRRKQHSLVLRVFPALAAESRRE